MFQVQNQPDLGAGKDVSLGPKFRRAAGAAHRAWARRGHPPACPLHPCCERGCALHVPLERCLPPPPWPSPALASWLTTHTHLD